MGLDVYRRRRSDASCHRQSGEAHWMAHPQGPPRPRRLAGPQLGREPAARPPRSGAAAARRPPSLSAERPPRVADLGPWVPVVLLRATGRKAVVVGYGFGRGIAG